METRQFQHIPVLADKVLELLDIQPGNVVVDTTAGGGGHLSLMASVNGQGMVIGIDRDARALEEDAAGKVKTSYGERVHLINARFSELPAVLEKLGITQVDRLLCDLGVSSEHLDNNERGFSFQSEGPLDMRMNTKIGETAYELIGRLSQEELANTIFKFGDERFSRRIAKVIKENPIENSTLALANLIARAVGRREKIHPATRTFQALRIAVNDELGELAALLNYLPGILAPEGRAAIISFHSLEDRLVKHAFRKAVSLCATKPKSFEILTKKPVIATSEEIFSNSRSRSAKLRVLLKKCDENFGDRICDFTSI